MSNYTTTIFYIKSLLICMFYIFVQLFVSVFAHFLLLFEWQKKELLPFIHENEKSIDWWTKNSNFIQITFNIKQTIKLTKWNICQSFMFVNWNCVWLILWFVKQISMKKRRNKYKYNWNMPQIMKIFSSQLFLNSTFCIIHLLNVISITG